MNTTITKFPEITEGSIFRAGINYNSFWQVTRRTNSTVWVRQISRQLKSSSKYNDHGTELPNKDIFVSEEVKCRLLKCDRPCIRPSYDFAFPWNGREVNFDHND